MDIGRNIHLIGGWHNEAKGNTNLFLYCYLIAEDKMTLIDTGSSIFPDRAIFPYMKSINLDPEKVSLILNTHGHSDHMGGNAKIREVSGARLAAHRFDVPYIEDHELQFKDRKVSPETRKWVLSMCGKNTKVDIVLDDGDEIEIAKGRTLKAMLTPGHSAGSLSFYDTAEKVSFIGDSIGIGEAVAHLPGYTDADAYVKSIERVSRLDLNFLLSGHGVPIRGAVVPDVLRRCLKLVEEIHRSVLSTLEEMQKQSSTADIAERACERLGYPSSPRTIEAHLNKLATEERVRRTMKGFDVFWELV